MMIRQLIEAIREHGMFPDEARVLCAVSGGADSMALILALSEAAGTLGIKRLAAVHFNHLLRGEESDRDEAFSAGTAARLGLEFFAGRGDVRTEAELNGMGIEETARKLRYEFLEQIAREHGFDRIATAHNANDNAETIIMNLVRGAGLNGLTGIPPVRGNIVRPLIYVTRREILTYLAGQGANYITDSSNQSSEYLRNRIRQTIMPALREINPNLENTISAAGRTLSQDAQYLDSLAREAVTAAQTAAGEVIIPVSRLLGLDSAIFGRAVKMLCTLAGGDGRSLGSKHITDVLEIVRGASPSAKISLPGSIEAARRYGELVFSPPRKQDSVFLCEVPIAPGKQVSFGRYTIRCERTGSVQAIEKNMVCLSESAVTGRLYLRTRRTGDMITLPGRPRKSLKKLFIETRIPLAERDRIPILCDEAGVAAVFGCGTDIRLVSKDRQKLLLWFG